MKRIFVLGILFFGVLFLGGCAPYIDVRPDYNENKKSVEIDDYIINDVTYYNEKRSNTDINSMGNTGYMIKQIRTDSGACSNIEVVDYEAKGNWFYHNSGLEDLKMRYKGHCDIDKVGDNAFFVKCFNNYFLTSSRTQHSGYGSKITLKMNESCFDDMKKHFKSKINIKYK